MSPFDKPIQQLITSLRPECSEASAPWQRGFSPRIGDNGLWTAAWPAVRCVIHRMSASAESMPVYGGEIPCLGGVCNTLFTHFYGVV